MRRSGKGHSALAWFGAAIEISLAAPAAHAADTELTPLTAWNVDWASDSCVAQRAFGDAKQPMVFRMERYGPMDAFQLIISGKQLRNLHHRDPMTVTYGRGGYAQRIRNITVGSTPSGATTVFIPSSSVIALPNGEEYTPWTGAISPQAEAAITEILLRYRAKTVVLKTGSLGRVFAEFRKCTDQLITAWGLDPAQQQTLQRRPVPTTSPGTWLVSSDYPKEALTNGNQSIIAFRLMVGADGKPTTCAVQHSYSGKLFDDVTCNALMRRARFQPALDAEGKPVPSYFISKVRWMMG